LLEHARRELTTGGQAFQTLIFPEQDTGHCHNRAAAKIEI
jgi:hypothetical protein